MLLKRYDIDSLDNRDESLLLLLNRLFHGLLMRYFRAEIRGLDRIPDGPGLFVGNHSGGLMPLDALVFGSAVLMARGLADAPYGLGHELAIRIPLVHQLIVPLGAVRASHENGLGLLRRGHKVIVYPGGDVDSMRPYRDRNRVVFDGRTGYIRLALEAGVPIIPVVSAGGHSTAIVLDDGRWLAKWLGLVRSPLRTHVWPIVLSVPWGLTVGPPVLYIPLPARLLVEVLEPISFQRTGSAAARDDGYVEACGRRVLETIEASLARLAEERESRRHPT
jgi:1-acyl-sn-glycerol-3-phosphate acyltransferase